MVGILQWWYGAGWVGHARRSYHGVVRTADFFSIGLLLKTLFAPFRQISAGQVGGGMPDQLRAWVDRLFSRAVGAVARSLVMLVGLLCLAGRAVWCGLSILAWSLLPLLPIAGVLLWQLGVAP